MKQKILLSLLLLFAASSASAYDFVVNGIYYNINGNEATVTFKGYGNMQTGYYSGDVTIPETVTHNGVTYAVTAIGRNAFASCIDPTTVTIPKSITDIASFSFNGSSGITSITISSDNPIYDSRDNCNAIIMTANNKLIAGCKNTVIPNTVTTIGNGAFWGCNSLTSVDIPNSVTTLEVQAFAYCTGLTSVTIGSSVTLIDQDAFGCCSSITSITIDSSNPRYDSRDNCNAIIRTASNTLIFGCQTTVIPNTVTTIGSWAFQECTGLTSITIPNSVKTINDHAFLNCTGLANATIPNSVKTIGDYAFSGCSALTSVNIPKSVTTIGNNPFSSCAGVMSITVESGNPKFDSRDNCNAIISTANNKLIIGCKNTIIPNSITAIGRSAFNDCIGLTSVTLPNTITSIEDNAFEDCKDLKDVYSYITDLTNVSIGEGAFKLFRYTSNYSQRTLHVPNGTADAYQADNNWEPYFGTIVEMDPVNIPGDINGDGEVNIADFNALANMLLDGDATIDGSPAADVNGDGKIDIDDISAMIDKIVNFLQ